MADRHTRERITRACRAAPYRARPVPDLVTLTTTNPQLGTFSAGGPPGPTGVGALPIGCPSHDFSAPTCQA
jgi:hypothetical protein